MLSSLQTDRPAVTQTRLNRPRQKPFFFWVILFALLVGGLIRSNWATRLDGFTPDEAYPIMAGASPKPGYYKINYYAPD